MGWVRGDANWLDTRERKEISSSAPNTPVQAPVRCLNSYQGDKKAQFTWIVGQGLDLAKSAVASADRVQAYTVQ